jgi:heat shock protein HslJ
MIFGACKSHKLATGGNSGDATLEETYWKLTELMGKPIGPTPADKKEVHIKLTKEGNKLEGFGGCNGFGGVYELKEGDRIKFSNIIGTMIACDVLETENQLLEILRTADNYNLKGKQLVLNKARMAPLARFEAVYFNK